MGYEQVAATVVCVLVVAAIVLCAVGIIIFLKKLCRKVCNWLFGQEAKESEKGRASEDIWHLLAPSLLGIVLCVVCLCGTSWAWFTVSRSSSVTPIQTAVYTVQLTVDDEDVPQTLDGESIMKIGMTKGQTYRVSLKANGTASTGYCKVTFEDQTYYTDQISADDTLAFTVNASKDSTMKIESQWGTCALESVDKIFAGRVIGEQLIQQEENNAPNDEEDETIVPESGTEETQVSDLESEAEPEQDIDTSDTETESDRDSDTEEDMPSIESMDQASETADIEEIQ